jgi:uncharacterized membrane protein
MPEKIPADKKYSTFFDSEVPADLIFMTIWLAAGIIAIYLPVLNETPLRYVLSIPIVFFIPGYCLIAALFPKADDIDILERIALSIGLSIAVAPLIGLVLNYTPWGIRLEPVVISLTIFTLVMILIAHYRRALVPAEERFRTRVFSRVKSISDEIVPTAEKGIDRFLSICLVIVIIITIVTTAFVILFPNEGERFSEFFILSEKMTSSGYPDQLIPEVNYPLYIGLGNQEHRNVTYTVETWILRTEFDTATNTSHILTMDPGERLTLTLAQNETRIIPYNLSVRESGIDRIEFLLFNETVPGSEITGFDRIDASYRDLHLWVESQANQTGSLDKNILL